MKTLAVETKRRPASAADHRSALQALRLIYAAARRHVAQVRRATGMGSALVWALDEIARAPGMRVGDLAEQMYVHPSTASNLCRQLRQLDLLESSTAGI